jgi:hypothetical protein
MAHHHSPKIVTDGLVLMLDAANPKSYPGSGTTWYDLSGNNFDFTLDGSGITWNSAGYFSLANGGATGNFNITDSTDCTFVFWMKTTDLQSLWWKRVGSTTSYLGAYRVSNKEYYNEFGTGIEFHMDLTEPANIYDNFPDGNWHMVEFKNVDMSNISTNEFNKYSSYTFGNGAVRSIMIYNRNITSDESLQNYIAYKSRFGI